MLFRTLNWRRAGLGLLLLIAAGCAPLQVQEDLPPSPPQPKPSIVVILPEADGKPSAVTVSNPAGTQTLAEPYQAVRIERTDAAPSPPFPMDPAEVRRVFGSVLALLPPPEAVFTLYFREGRDTLDPAEFTDLPAILSAIRERRSTSISVIGHTDTTADSNFNQQLGMRRAQSVAASLEANGVDSAALTVDSHGDADLTVKTARGVSEPRNRRVEVIVR